MDEADATPPIRRSGTSIIALTVKDILEEQIAGKLAQLGFFVFLAWRLRVRSPALPRVLGLRGVRRFSPTGAIVM